MPAGAAKARAFCRVCRVCRIFGEDGFSERLFQIEVSASGDLLESCNKRLRVRDDDDLCVPAGCGDETCERRQQVGMKAGLRFVEDHEAGRPRREQCGDPE